MILIYFSMFPNISPINIYYFDTYGKLYIMYRFCTYIILILMKSYKSL